MEIFPTLTFKNYGFFIIAMLTTKEIEFLQNELETAQKPYFIHDGDADGLCSFLLLYRRYQKGKGFIVKSSSTVDISLAQKVEEYNPDKIVVLDMPLMEQEFVDKVKRPIFWIDHHPLQKLHNVFYFNPRSKDDSSYFPTTRMAYQVSADPKDMWIAMAGCLADWHIPSFIDEFMEKYPHLLSKKSDLPTMVYKEPVGKLVKMFNFFLKGEHSDVIKCVKILTRITSPDEIFKQETSQGKFLWKKYESVNKKYEPLLEKAKKEAKKGKLLIFSYLSEGWSFTSELSNELSALYPKKVIIIVRNKSGEMKCSLRAKVPIIGALERALVGIEGHGGGHPKACGAVIKEKDWERFLENFQRELKDD